MSNRLRKVLFIWLVASSAFTLFDYAVWEYGLWTLFTDHASYPSILSYELSQYMPSFLFVFDLPYITVSNIIYNSPLLHIDQVFLPIRLSALFILIFSIMFREKIIGYRREEIDYV